MYDMRWYFLEFTYIYTTKKIQLAKLTAILIVFMSFILAFYFENYSYYKTTIDFHFIPNKYKNTIYLLHFRETFSRVTV